MELIQESGQLCARPPFDFDQSLRFLGNFTPAKGEQSVTQRAIVKAVMIEGEPVVFQVHSVGTVEEPLLAYTLFSERPLADATRELAKSRVRDFLSLDDDLGPLYAVGSTDPAFAPIMNRLFGLHQVRFLTPFEITCWAVLSQRTHLSIAQGVKRRFVERFGRALEVAGETYWAFPEPAQVASLPFADVLAAVGNDRRARYLAAIAAAFVEVDETWLRTAPYEEVETWLRALPGIGPWSTAFVLLRGLGRMERVPLSEGKVGDVAEQRYGRGKPQGETALREIADRYGRWQGYWAYYLRAAG